MWASTGIRRLECHGTSSLYSWLTACAEEVRTVGVRARAGREAAAALWAKTDEWAEIEVEALGVMAVRDA